MYTNTWILHQYGLTVTGWGYYILHQYGLTVTGWGYWILHQYGLTVTGWGSNEDIIVSM